MQQRTNLNHALRRLLALALALVMLLSLTGPAFAEENMTLEEAQEALPPGEQGWSSGSQQELPSDEAQASPVLPDTSYSPFLKDWNRETNPPAPAKDTYVLGEGKEQITFYNTYVDEDTLPGDFLIGILDTAHPALGNRSIMDKWLQLGAGIMLAGEPSYFSEGWTDAIFNGNESESSGVTCTYYNPKYASSLNQAAQKIAPDWWQYLTGFSNEEGSQQKEVVAKALQLRNSVHAVTVAAYLTDIKAVPLQPEDKDGNFVTEVIKPAESKTDKKYAAEIINNSLIPVTASQNLTNSVSNTVSSSVNHSDTTSLSKTLNVGLEQTFEIDFGFVKSSTKFSMSSNTTWGNATTDGWTKGESTTKSETVSETASITLPPYTTAILEQGHAGTEILKSYNCPVSLEYSVILVVTHDFVSSPFTLKRIAARFEGDSRANLWSRALQYGKFDVETGSDYSAAIHWNNVTANDHYAQVIDDITSYVPFAPVSAALRQTVNLTYNEVSKIAPTEPLAIVKLLPPSQNFIGSESYTYGSYDYLKATMRVGDSSFTNYLELEGLNRFLAPYYGFDPTCGHWIVARRDGTPWTEADGPAPVVLSKDEGSGYMRYTAVSPGTCFLLYLIDEDVYGTYENDLNVNAPFTTNNRLTRTAALEITVSGHKPYSDPQGKVMVSGSFVGVVGQPPVKLDAEGTVNGTLHVAIEDKTGKRLDDNYFFQKQELDRDGILVNEDNAFSFTKPGVYHVRAICDQIDAYSDWYEIVVHEYDYSAEGAELTAACTEGDVTATLTIAAPTLGAAGTGYAATVSGSIPAVETPAVVYHRGGHELAEPPTEPGDYSASITLGGATASVNYRIEGPFVFTPPHPYTLTYNGQHQQLVQPGTAHGVMFYAIGPSDGSAPVARFYTAAVPTGYHAGTYPVWYKAVDPNAAYPDSAVYGPLLVTVAKADRPTPAAPTAEKVTDLTITLAPIEDGEYRMFGGAWQASPVFTGLRPNTRYSFQQRYAETDDYNRSAYSDLAYIYTTEDGSIKVAPKARSLTFNGEEQALVEAGQTYEGRMLYALGTNDREVPDDSLFTETVPTALHAGSYYVWYRAEGDIEARCLEAGIAKAERPEPPDPPTVDTYWFQGVHATWVYLNTKDGLEYSIGEDGVWSGSDKVVFDGLTPSTTYSFYARRPAGDDYLYPSLRSDPLTIITSQYDAPASKFDLYYNGEEQELFYPGYAGLGQEYRFSTIRLGEEHYTSKIPTRINAGEYQYYYALFDKSSNTILDGPRELEPTIHMATANISFPVTELHATGEPQPLIVDPVITPRSGVDVYYSLDDTENELSEPPMAVEPGRYQVFYRLQSHDERSCASIPYGAPVTIRILGDINEALKDTEVFIDNWVYSDTPSEPTIVNNPHSIPVVYTYAPRGAHDSEFTSQVPIEAGDYTMKAHFSHPDYVNERDILVDFTISKKVPVLGEDYTITPYTGIATGEFRNLVDITTREGSFIKVWCSLDKLNVTSSAPRKTDAGIYEIWYKVSGDANYESINEWCGPVIAELTGKHNVLLSTAGSGTVETDKDRALPGETVTLTTKPLANYVTSAVIVKAGEESVPVFRGLDDVYTFNMPNADVTVSVVFAQSAIIGADLRLDGVIGLRFYVRVPETFNQTFGLGSGYEEPYMSFVIHGRVVTVKLSEAEAMDSGLYLFTCPITSIEMAEPVNAVFHYGGDGLARTTYSIKQYLDDTRNLSSRYGELVDAIQNYGHYMQAYLARINHFIIGEGGYAEMPAASELTPLLDLSDFRRQWGPEAYDASLVDSMRYYLKLDSTTALGIRLYLNSTPASYSATVDGQEWPVTDRGGNVYQIEIPGISAGNLGKAYHVVFTADDRIVYDIYTSCLSFADSLLADPSAPVDTRLAYTSLYHLYAAVRNHLDS